MDVVYIVKERRGKKGGGNSRLRLSLDEKRSLLTCESLFFSTLVLNWDFFLFLLSSEKASLFSTYFRISNFHSFPSPSSQSQIASKKKVSENLSIDKGIKKSFTYFA